MKKKFRKFSVLVFTICIVMICSITALGASKKAETEKNYVFAVPEGGWSSCKVHIIYTENYGSTAAGTRNLFSERTKYYTGTYEYATACPTLKTSSVVYKYNGDVVRTFSSWTKKTSIYPGTVDTFGYYSNSEKEELSATTSYTGQLNYTVSLYGANPPSYVKYVSMKLNTK